MGVEPARSQGCRGARRLRRDVRAATREFCKILSAEELDAMTPDQRAAAFDERIVHDLDELPVEFRNRIMEAGRGLGEELRSNTRE